MLLKEGKILRIFNLVLTEEELSYRRKLAGQIARKIVEEAPWVSDVHLFGSTARGDARRSSDIDLAIITEAEPLVPGVPLDIPRIIDEAKNELGVLGLIVSPIVICRHWLEDPENPRITSSRFSEFLINIKEEGSVLALNPLYDYLR